MALRRQSWAPVSVWENGAVHLSGILIIMGCEGINIHIEYRRARTVFFAKAPLVSERMVLFNVRFQVHNDLGKPYFLRDFLIIVCVFVVLPSLQYFLISYISDM